MRLGVDFDNTIVCYDQLFHRVALEKGLIPEKVLSSKEEVRGYLRQQGQEQAWTELQGDVYGPRIQEATPFPGVLEFLGFCKQQNITFCIISHKTEYAKYDVDHTTNLRTAALSWMSAQQFFSADGLGLSRTDVLFGTTRQEKIEHIRHVGCTHFIDDLEEVFLEKTFPVDVEKILFAPNHQSKTLPGVTTVSSWQKIREYIFGVSS